MFSRRKIVVTLLVLLLAGCAHKHNNVAVTAVQLEQERTFAGALEFLKTGREQAARESLERVITLAPINGITDEALFRLALLSLRDEGGRGPVRTITLLDRLESEYPRSIWTYQAVQLTSYLTSLKTLRDKQREVKNLRDLNLSLSRDNRELRQTIERLKSLDIELGQKLKH